MLQLTHWCIEASWFTKVNKRTISVTETKSKRPHLSLSLAQSHTGNENLCQFSNPYRPFIISLNGRTYLLKRPLGDSPNFRERTYCLLAIKFSPQWWWSTDLLVTQFYRISDNWEVVSYTFFNLKWSIAVYAFVFYTYFAPENVRYVGTGNWTPDINFCEFGCKFQSSVFFSYILFRVEVWNPFGDN